MATNINTAFNVGSPATATLTIASPSGNDRKVVAVLLQERSSESISSAPTLNGITATAQVGTVITSSNIQHAAIWYWDDADLPATAGNYSVATTGLGATSLSVISADGVAQGAQSDLGSSAIDGTSATSTLSLAGVGALLVGGFARNSGAGTVTPEAGQTLLLADTAVGSSHQISSYASDINTHGYVSSLSQPLAMLVASFDPSTPFAGVSINTPPTDINVGTANSVTVTSTATVPTTANTTVNINGLPITPSSVTANGGDSYTINFTAPRSLVLLYSATGYPVSVTVGADTSADTANIPFLPEAGTAWVDAVNPNTVDNWSFFAGYTGNIPVTGFQGVYQAPVGGTVMAVLPNGALQFSPKPTATTPIPRYFREQDGTVGAQSNYILEIDGSPVPSGNKPRLTSAYGAVSVSLGEAVSIPSQFTGATSYEEQGLPDGCSINATTGEITGFVNSQPKGVVTVIAKNSYTTGVYASIPWDVYATPLSRVGVSAGQVTINGTVTQPTDVYLSPFGLITTVRNGESIGVIDGTGASLIISGVTIAAPSVLYLSPQGLLTNIPNGKPVANFK